jgi:hypothetical protein
MNVEHLVGWELAEENEVLRDNPLQFHFIHHKSHMTWLDSFPVNGKLCIL